MFKLSRAKIRSVGDCKIETIYSIDSGHEKTDAVKSTQLFLPGAFSRQLFVLFLVLKLCHVINWPWLWVSSPVWIPMGVFAVSFVAGFIAAGLEKLIKFMEKKYVSSKS